MAKYRIKKPEVEAVRWSPGVFVYGLEEQTDASFPYAIYTTIDGTTFSVYAGDYLLFLEDGTIELFYGDEFEAMYEPVE